MAIPFQSCLSIGVATVIAATITLSPPAHEPLMAASPAPVVQVVSPPVALTALATPTVTAAALPTLLTDFVRRIVIPPSAGSAPPSVEFPPTVIGTSIDTTIKNVYNRVEPWVQYGFELATYAAGWVPWVGWLSPQIMYFYFLGERIVRSITFNIADWIGGTISFGAGLRNVAVDSINSLIYFANDQIAFWLPPLPPIPPIGPLGARSEPEMVGARTARQLPVAVGTGPAELPTEPETPLDDSVTEPSEDVDTPANDLDEDLDADVDPDTDIDLDTELDEPLDNGTADKPDKADQADAGDSGTKPAAKRSHSEAKSGMKSARATASADK